MPSPYQGANFMSWKPRHERARKMRCMQPGPNIWKCFRQRIGERIGPLIGRSGKEWRKGWLLLRVPHSL